MADIGEWRNLKKIILSLVVDVLDSNQGAGRCSGAGESGTSAGELQFLIISLFFWQYDTIRVGLLMLAFHDADTDTDTDSPNTAIQSYVRHTLFPREASRGNSVCRT